MNKLKYLLIFVFIFVLLPNKVLADDKYYLKSFKDNKMNDISSYNTYNEALQNMNKYDSKEDDFAIIYHNDKIINCQYSYADIGGHGIIYIYRNATDKEKGVKYYTYLESNWGSDAAFIDYYEAKTPMVKIAISGVVGWTELSNVSIVPLKSSNVRITTTKGVNIRKETSASSEKIGFASYNNMYTYYDIKDNEGYTWYKIQINNQYGWIASKNGAWVEKVNNNLATYYIPEKNVLKHVFRASKFGSAKLSLGPSPSYLENNKKYYSFDGIYFYDTLIKMIKDYKNDTFENSVNYKTPYYNYYLYLPSHSLTGYNKDDFNNIIINFGYTKGRKEGVTYVSKTGSFISGVDRSGISALYDEGVSFINFQNNYGLNAFAVFSTAINESGKGTNVYAMGKNNILSIGVCDSCKYENTKTYNTIYDNLIAYASLVNGSYSNPNSGLYYGSHPGNKGSGMNISYASDPYWGEKQAQIYYTRDRDYGGSDYNNNVIGIKQGFEDVKIYKRPYYSSDTIYTLKNKTKNQSVNNIPLIVLGKVVTTENGKETTWYKVYTDVALDDNQNIISSPYVFNKSFGYVEAKYIYLSNAEDVKLLNPEGYLETDGLFHLEKLVFDDDKLTFNGF